MIMVRWCSLLIILVIFKDTFCTEWNGLTPWYTGSKCNCNGYSNRCFFDRSLYEQTGHGGHCMDCTANRDGPNCERCQQNFYMREDGYCIACDCNEIGSTNLQCNAEGKCQCKPGVTGDKCDSCHANHHDFSTQGCKSCGCLEEGSSDNEPSCNPYTGACICKENVEGIRCRECKPGFFNLDKENTFGCTPCFCYGHSSLCRSAPGFSKYLLESAFSRGSEGWRVEDRHGRRFAVKYDTYGQNIGVQSTDDEMVYFVAPDRFLGDQRASYNQLLEFSLRIGDNRPFSTATDVILEGAGSSITNNIFAQQNRMPSVQSQKYSFRLHEHPDYGWQPRLSSRKFISVLANLTAIKIKGTYSTHGVGQLDEVKLETAARGIAGEPALWIESCDCPTGYIGQHCESCAPGFRHSPSLGGPFMSCIPCDCNNHANICDSETGRCICEHNTAGENCELCAKGYYGNALAGTTEDCQPCLCPNGGPCIEVDEETVMCTECPVGYTGHRCDSCSEGYFGDPTGQFGPPRNCVSCECNMNIDPNGIGNCDPITGECLRCIYNTGGPRCDICLSGFYGNALVLPKGDCKPCQCYPAGTEGDVLGAPACDQTTGSCECRAHVTGRNCDKCETGYYNLHSGEGCQSCNCDPIGSYNQTCDIYTGQCYCKPGVTGIRCDHCEATMYGFSSEGCKKCECDSIGSKDLQCDPTGQCPCLDNVEGLKCDRCKENKYDRKRGCVNCPDCYNLVQDEVRSHNTKLDQLYDVLDQIEHQPTVITDEEFPEKLNEVKDDIDQLHRKVRNLTGENSLVQQVEDVQNREKDVSRTLSEIDEKIFLIQEHNSIADRDNFNAEQVLEEATDRLSEINSLFDYQGKKSLEDALERSNLVGQQSVKMTDIAHTSRNLADSLDTQSEEIIRKAKDARNNSIEAYNKVKNANYQLNQVSDAIQHIKDDVFNTELKLNKTKEWTKEVSDKAVIVKDNALALFDEVKNLVVPEINVSELKQKSNDLKEEAYRLKSKSSEIFNNSEELRNEIEEQNNQGKELLQKAQDQQDEVIDLRNDLVLSDTQAKEAIHLWNEILESAESNYKLLAEFDTQTQRSKEEAEESLRTIKEIEVIINKTVDNTNDARSNLEDAKLNADLALEKALNADEIAKNASSTAERIKQDAELLYKNTTALSEEAELMFGRVRNTEGEYKNLYEKIKNNETLVNEAKDKVGRAGRDTNEASKKILFLLGDVDKILTELQSSPNLNDEDITRLEEQIRVTEEQIRNAKLEEKLKELEKEHQRENELIDQYKSQIIILQKEVENIEQIVKALPKGCYRRDELEP